MFVATYLSRKSLTGKVRDYPEPPLGSLLLSISPMILQRCNSQSGIWIETVEKSASFRTFAQTSDSAFDQPLSRSFRVPASIAGANTVIGPRIASAAVARSG